MLGFGVILTCTILSLGGSFFIPREAGAQAPNEKVSFNASEVVERVSHYPRMEGDRIVIQDKSYTAEFSEGEAVLAAREGTPGSEDVVIPVSGTPEIRKGKVVYSSWEGEVEFEGGRRGLRYQERDSMSYNPLLQYKYHRDSSRWMRDSYFHFRPGQGGKVETTSGEFLLDTNIVYTNAPETEFPAIAFDGRNYMVVWEDCRFGNSSIFGVRVTPDGVLLDSSGITISPPPGEQYTPSIAFDGVNYLVIWNQNIGGGNDYSICGARVTPGGTVLDPNGISISTYPSYKNWPAITFGESFYLVIWYDERNGLEIYGARVTPAGRVLDSNGFPITTGSNFHFAPAVAFDQRNFLVVWGELHGKSSNTEVYGARVTQSGVVLDTTGIAITNNQPHEQEYPKVAFDGTNYLVAWMDARVRYWDTYGARITPDGVVLDTGGFAITTIPNCLNGLSFDGRNYLAVWFNGYLYGTRVTPEGVVLDTLGIPISKAPNNPLFPVAAFDGRNYLVAWQNGGSTNALMYCSRVTPQGQVLDTSAIEISITANGQVSPSAAFDGRNYLVAWQEGAEGNPPYAGIYGARVSAGGVVLDPIRIKISVSPWSESSPDVSFDGRNYLAVWQGGDSTYTGIRGARVSPGGVVLDTAGLSISTTHYERSPSAAFDGRNYLIVWQDNRGGSSDIIYGARVNPSGVVLDTNGIAISPSGTSPSFSKIAFDGYNYLVVWEIPGVSVVGSRVTPGGVVLDTTPIVIGTSSYFYWGPSLAISFDGRNYLVVWSGANPGNSYDIIGARVTPSGVVLDPHGLNICTSPNDQVSPAVGFDGDNYNVVWSDRRNGPSWNLYGAKLNPSGFVIDSFPVVIQARDQITPTIVHGSLDQLLVAYSGFTSFINGRSTNTMRIWGKLSPWSAVADKKETPQNLGVGVTLRIYPNPFSEKARFDVGFDFKSLSMKDKASLKVYDALGRLVRDFPPEALKRGSFDWDGADDHGLRLPGGVYFVRLEQGGSRTTQKVILLR